MGASSKPPKTAAGARDVSEIKRRLTTGEEELILAENCWLNDRRRKQASRLARTSRHIGKGIGRGNRSRGALHLATRDRQARRYHRDVKEARSSAPRGYRPYRLASCRERGRVTGIQLSALDGSAFMLWSYN